MNIVVDQAETVRTSHILQHSHCSYEDAKPAQAVKTRDRF